MRRVTTASSGLRMTAPAYASVTLSKCRVCARIMPTQPSRTTELTTISTNARTDLVPTEILSASRLQA